MKIAVLNKYIYDLIKQLGQAGSVVAVSSDCNIEREGNIPRFVTDPTAVSKPKDLVLSEYLSEEILDLDALRDSAPDIVLAAPHEDVDLKDGTLGGVVNVSEVETRLREALNNPKVRLVCYRPKTLDQIYRAIQGVGEAIKVAPLAREKVNKLRAQVMDWGDNFYERTKSKRVTFISSVSPLKLAGRWIPDLISLCSSTSQVRVAGLEDEDVDWRDILDFKPDVIVVAPSGCNAQESARTFKVLERFPGWENVPAVVRGEVVFCDGNGLFYHPYQGLIDSMSILVSAIAGLEPGYISPRESFHRLRWLELHRHRL